MEYEFLYFSNQVVFLKVFGLFDLFVTHDISPRATYVTQFEFFSSRALQSLYQSNWLNIFTQLSKIFTHFRDRGGTLCFLTHPVIPLIILAWQNYVYQRYSTRCTFPFEILKLSPTMPLRGRRSSIFVSTDSFLKNIEYIILSIFRSKVYFSRHLASSIFLLHPV